MPALSPTMTEGNLARWLKNEGDPIKSGDVIAEIETDKATMEVEAVDEGTLGKILVQGGTEGVKVNQPIALLLEEGEDKSALEGAGPAARQPPHRRRAVAAASRPRPRATATPGRSTRRCPRLPGPRPSWSAPTPSRAAATARPGRRRRPGPPAARATASSRARSPAAWPSSPGSTSPS